MQICEKAGIHLKLIINKQRNFLKGLYIVGNAKFLMSPNVPRILNDLNMHLLEVNIQKALKICSTTD
jgi:hypothetical protein